MRSSIATKWAKALLALEEPFVLAGDYNAIPAENDVYDAQAWEGDALFRPETRTRKRVEQNIALDRAGEPRFEDCIGT